MQTRKSLRDHNIRQICDVQEIIKWSRTRRKEWKQLIQRMPDGRIAKSVMTGIPSTTRPPGRPPKGCRECWTLSSTEG